MSNKQNLPAPKAPEPEPKPMELGHAAVKDASISTIAIIADLLNDPSVTLAQLSEKYGISYQSVSSRLLRMGISKSNLIPSLLRVWESKRADLLALKQAEVLASITPEKLEKATASQAAIAFGILYDKERLERNKSTANVAYSQIVCSLDDVRQKKQARAKEIEALELELVREGEG